MEHSLTFIQDRACLNCGIVKTFGEFYEEGCPNCEVYLKYRYSSCRVLHCTTSNFHDLCILPESYTHWLPRIGPIGSLVYGAYAKFSHGYIPWLIIKYLADDNA